LQLEEVVILGSERILEIWIKAIKRVLTKFWHFIPRVESWKVLICTRECQLYPKTAIYLASFGLAVGSFDCTILTVEADKASVTRTFSTTIPFPIRVLQPALLKLKHLHHKILLVFVFQRWLWTKKWFHKWWMKKGSYKSKAGYSVWTICNKSRSGPRSIFPTGKCNHIPIIVLVMAEEKYRTLWVT
jgi:hypothetical protein